MVHIHTGKYIPADIHNIPVENVVRLTYMHNIPVENVVRLTYPVGWVMDRSFTLPGSSQ